MRCRRRLAPFVAGLLLFATPAHAQHPVPLPATAPVRFESWQPTAPALESSRLTGEQLVTAQKNRKRQALIGGAIGAAAAFALCTTISTLTDDSADGGVSFCPLDTTLLMVGGGFAVGAAIGWAI